MNKHNDNKPQRPEKLHRNSKTNIMVTVTKKKKRKITFSSYYLPHTTTSILLGKHFKVCGKSI